MRISPLASASGEEGGALRDWDLLLRAVDGAERDGARRVGVAMRAFNDVLAGGGSRRYLEQTTMGGTAVSRCARQPVVPCTVVSGESEAAMVLGRLRSQADYSSQPQHAG